MISDSAASLSGIDLSAFDIREIAIRGSARPLDVRVVPQGAVLALEVREESAAA